MCPLQNRSLLGCSIEVPYVCKYTSGHFIPNSVYNQDKIRDKMSTSISAGIGDSGPPLFTTFKLLPLFDNLA